MFEPSARNHREDLRDHSRPHLEKARQPLGPPLRTHQRRKRWRGREEKKETQLVKPAQHREV